MRADDIEHERGAERVVFHDLAHLLGGAARRKMEHNIDAHESRLPCRARSRRPDDELDLGRHVRRALLGHVHARRHVVKNLDPHARSNTSVHHVRADEARTAGDKRRQSTEIHLLGSHLCNWRPAAVRIRNGRAE
eukprot:Amastigsp_a514143_64.p4 type:complete len:135 gc:universal Amastigsp_a514143_64:878-1282(+)